MLHYAVTKPDDIITILKNIHHEVQLSFLPGEKFSQHTSINV